MSKQIQRRALPGVQTEADRLERALRNAFVNSASALKSRPEPRHRFDNAARPHGATRPWADFAEPLRDCAIEAMRAGGTTAEVTEERIVDAIIALLAYVTEPFERAVVGTVSYLNVAREVPEAIDWMARAHLTPCVETVARADREIHEATLALTLHRGGLRTRPATSRRLGLV